MADSRFTSTALGAIRLAQENAVRLGHCYVGSEHLLLGLACQEYSLAARLLGEAGADSRSLRAAVVQLVGAGAPGPTLRQGLTPRCSVQVLLILKKWLLNQLKQSVLLLMVHETY